MIAAIESYILTNGNGKEAVAFYQKALNAKLVSLTTRGEVLTDCPKEQRDLVLNAHLDVEGIRLQISDEDPEVPYQEGRNVSIVLIVNSVSKAKELFDALTVAAKEILLPLQETFWSPTYANFVDQFGVMWQISTELEVAHD